MTLARCSQLGDPLSCGNVTRTASGFISSIRGLLQNIGQIKTSGIEATFNLRSSETGAGSFGLLFTGNYLDNYEETFPTADGVATINFRGTTRGFPDQSYPKFKGTSILSWAMGGFDASFTGRYIHSVDESDGNKLGSRFYGDVQLSFTPKFMDENFRFSAGVINLFDTDPPACFSCTGPNFDPTAYDIPGQFGYVRLTYRM